MKQLLVVGLGGFLGAISRYKLGGAILHGTTAWRFPLSTFVINVAGCFCIGLVAGLIERHDLFSANTRLFLITGILGGFTTFSAFAFENVYLLRRGEAGIAFAYAALSVIAGLAAVWLALKLALWLPITAGR